MTPSSPGAELIAAERRRQVEAEGWTPEHDDEHRSGELIAAAISYAQAADPDGAGDCAVDCWPFIGGFKPSDDPIRNLVRAGALIAAEIDRLNRAVEVAAGPPTAPKTQLHIGNPMCVCSHMRDEHDEKGDCKGEWRGGECFCDAFDEGDDEAEPNEEHGDGP